MFRQKRKATKGIFITKSTTKCLALRRKVQLIEEKLTTFYSDRRRKMEDKAISQIKQNPKAFYAYAKRFQKTYSGIGPIISPDGEILTEPAKIAEAQKLQYEKVFSEPNQDKKVINPEEFFKITEKTKISNIHFNYMDIREAIDQLSVNASAGPDGVPAIFLKRARDNLSEPLTILWNTSLETGQIPELFKLAFITPVLKPGAPKCETASYRPVSLTSHLVKTFERVLKKVLQNHLEVTLALNDQQHGFRSKRSCLSQLLSHYNEILKGMEEGGNVDTVYLDFSKAFDKVDIGILMHKMRDLGVHGSLAVWIYNFLTNRKQVVIANGVKSSVSQVKSGVPQGTVLGPLLFLIMINDIDENITESMISIFADDTRLTKVINQEADFEKFQEDLEKLYNWAETNNMAFNGTKFELLRYGFNEELKTLSNYLTPNAENIIEIKDVLRDLGVIMNDKATFADHIDKVCSQVTQKAGWILRTFQCRRTAFLKQMWKSLVQGHIDYCSQLYQPLQSTNLQRIENLQKVYTKRIPEVSDKNYWERLKVLKLNSQQRRLERYRIIYTWKILEGLAPNCDITLHEPVSERAGRKCNIPKIKTKTRQSVKTLREQSFQVHGPQLFNCLPLSIRNKTKCSVLEFKEVLDNYLTLIPDQPKVGMLIPSTCDMFNLSPSNSLIDQIREYQAKRTRTVG